MPAAGGKFLAICSPEMHFLKGFEEYLTSKSQKFSPRRRDLVPINWVSNKLVPIKDFRIKSGRINTQSQLTFWQKLNRSQLSLIGAVKGGGN